MASDNTLVHLDLDTLEREQVAGIPKKKANPFYVTANGRRITFRDAVELNHLILATMEDTPQRFFKAAIADKDELQHFLSWANDSGEDGRAGLTGIKLRGLLQGNRDYFGLDKMGNVVGS